MDSLYKVNQLCLIYCGQQIKESSIDAVKIFRNGSTP